MSEQADKHYGKQDVIDAVLLELHKEFGDIELDLEEVKKNSY